MTNRFWRIDARPKGTDFSDALHLIESPMPEPGDGEIVIRNAMLSMDAGTRMWLTARTDGYQPPLETGMAMTGLVIGEISASRHPNFPEGTLVRAFGQWADYSLVDPVLAGDPNSYAMESYTYRYQEKYGSEEILKENLGIELATVAADLASVRLQVSGLREMFVHELRAPGVRSATGIPLLHDRAYYTLNRIPSR